MLLKIAPTLQGRSPLKLEHILVLHMTYTRRRFAVIWIIMTVPYL